MNFDLTRRATPLIPPAARGVRSARRAVFMPTVLLSLLIASLSLQGCVTSKTDEVGDQSAAVTSNEDATLVAVSGQGVRVKRSNGVDWVQPVLNTHLYIGDLLLVTAGSTAIVRCSADEADYDIPDDGEPWGVANFCS